MKYRTTSSHKTNFTRETKGNCCENMHFIFTIAAFFVSLQCALAANEVRFILNNGFSPGMMCDKYELSLINAVFTTTPRKLRGNTGSNSIMNETALAPLGRSRELLTFGSNCANICANIAAGSCYKRGCRGFRALQTKDQKGTPSTPSTVSTPLTCADDINAIHAQLDALKVSNLCHKFLFKGFRQAECYADYEYGRVDGVRVRNTASQTIISQVLPGGRVTVCKSFSLNFDSINEPCVYNATFKMQGPNYYRETCDTSVPYSLFGETGNAFNGQKLPSAGTYTLMIIPDLNTTKTKTFTVVVNNNC